MLSPKSSLAHLQAQSLHTSWIQALQGGSPGSRSMARVSGQNMATGRSEVAQHQGQNLVTQPHSQHPAPLNRSYQKPCAQEQDVTGNPLIPYSY